MDSSFEGVKENVSQYNCVICYSSFCLTECENRQQQQSQKIDQMYRLYLEPEVNCTSVDRDLQSEYLTSNRFCAKCYNSGEQLSVMNEQLTSIQLKIQIFVKQLLKEITDCRYYAKKLVQSSSGEICLTRDLLNGCENAETDANKTKPDFNAEIKQEWPEKEENIGNSLSDEDDDCIFENVTEWISNNDLILMDYCRLTSIDSTELLHGDVDPKKEILDSDSIDCVEDSPLCQTKAVLNNAHRSPLSRKISSEFELPKLTVKLERVSPKIIKRYISRTSFKASSNLNQEKKTTRILKQRREQATNSHAGRKQKIRKRTKVSRRYELEEEDDDSFGEDSNCDDKDDKDFTTLAREKRDEKQYKCITCSEEFSNQFDYEVHKMKHRGEIPYECQKCHEKFSNVVRYCAHQKQLKCRKSFGVYKCDQCDELFDAQYLLLVHTTRKHTDLNDSCKMCSICGKKNLSPKRVECHYMEHTNEGVYSCDICGQPNFFTAKMVKKHRRSHTLCLKCSYCDKFLSKPDALKRHIAIVHNIATDSAERICEICGKVCNNAISLKAHMHRHQRIQCDECPKTFTASCTLQQHKRVFHRRETYSCEVCGRKYNTTIALKQHMNIVHLKLPKQFICEACGKAFGTETALKTHVQNIHAQPIIQCDICGKIFTTINKLRHHKTIHTDEKVTCKACNMSFRTYWKLSHHFNSRHPELKNNKFQCTRCHLNFDTIFERVKHWKQMHPTEKKEVKKICNLCGGFFSGTSAIKRHLIRHERDKFGPLKCEQCDFRFIKQQSLTYHVKHYHGPSSTSTDLALH